MITRYMDTRYMERFKSEHPKYSWVSYNHAYCETYFDTNVYIFKRKKCDIII